MNDHYTKNIDDWKKAGRIAAEALEFGRNLIVPGIGILTICQKVDQKIKELGANPAFPTQISLNHIAAHNCPDEDDSTELSDQVVKIDVGVEVNGAIGDNAATVDLSGKHNDLVLASRDALNNAIRIIRPGTTLNEVGQEIEDTIKQAGFVPVVNLSGHGLDYHTIHDKPTIPNFASGDPTEIEEGMIFAIEPFASTGSGRVAETETATIFSEVSSKPVRTGREVLSAIKEYGGLPFVSRWLNFPAFKKNFALREFTRLGVLRSYPPLADTGKGLISQAEHTVLVTKDGCQVLTVI